MGVHPHGISTSGCRHTSIVTSRNSAMFVQGIILDYSNANSSWIRAGKFKKKWRQWHWLCVLAPCLTVMLTVKTVKISGITVKKAGAPKFAQCVEWARTGGVKSWYGSQIWTWRSLRLLSCRQAVMMTLFSWLQTVMMKMKTMMVSSMTLTPTFTTTEQ